MPRSLREIAIDNVGLNIKLVHKPTGYSYPGVIKEVTQSKFLFIYHVLDSEWLDFYDIWQFCDLNGTPLD